MDEKQAWNSFARTGKIEDYIRYAKLRDRAPELLSAVREAYGAGKNSGIDHSGADHRGERPVGNGADS